MAFIMIHQVDYRLFRFMIYETLHPCSKLKLAGNHYYDRTIYCRRFNPIHRPSQIRIRDSGMLHLRHVCLICFEIITCL